MSLRVGFLPEAASDMEAAFWWYEQQQSGLGQEFLKNLDVAFREAADRPLSFPLVVRRTRKVVVRRFPYLVFFAVEGERVLVTGVFHAHRDPGSWEDRIREGVTAYVGKSVLWKTT